MSGLKLDIKNLDKALADLNTYASDAVKIINNEFFDFAQSTVNDAKSNAPVDEGRLRQSIYFNKENLKVTIQVNVDYAAYLEFGTKSFAATYVSTLPATWQEFAAQFKGPGGSKSSFITFVFTILEWVQRKGFAATYSVKSQKRSNAKASISNEYSAAYAIALSIIKKGIRPHPYLIPAFEKNKIILINNLKRQLNAK